MPNITLQIENKRYTGWEGMSLTSSIESIADPFSLDVQANIDEISEEDECSVHIEDQLVLSGWVEHIVPSFSGDTDDFLARGQSRTGLLVKCSAELDAWSFKKATVFDIAKKVCEPYGIEVTIQPEIKLALAPPKLSIAPGETGFEILLAAAKSSGILLVSTPGGGLLLTRSGVERATDALVEGVNIAGGTGNYNSSERYYRYIALAQSAGTDKAFAKATKLKAEAFDVGVRRQNQTLILRPETGHSQNYNKVYADWEARIRAANSRSAQIFVHGWTQSDGSLWKKNTVTPVSSKRLRIDGEDRLISRVDFGHGTGGPVTALRVVRTDAFEPNPAGRVIE